MISITERLRARHEPVGDGTGTWRPDGLCQEAADIMDELVEALKQVEEFAFYYTGKMKTIEGDESLDAVGDTVRAAIALAKAGGEGK